ncbi:MAG: HAD family phosphatase [Anaerolineales bacterium]|nr:HAD family phosphatase [Anaerolineales bacterium]
MTIRAVIFDIGNVLEINSETGWQEKWEKRLQLDLGEVFKRLVSMEKNGSLGTCTEEEWIQGLREVTGMSQAQTDEFMNDLWHWYLGTLNEELTLFFAGLRSHYQTAILSNSFVGARTKEQEKYHFHEITDQIIYSHEVGLAKPDKRIYELTCERLSMQPEEIIFVDDAEPNIVAALEYGIHGILFKSNAQVIADIQTCISANAS